MSEWKDKAEGKVNEVKGAVTGDRSEETKGQAQQGWGEVEGKADDAMDKVGDAIGGNDDNADNR